MDVLTIVQASFNFLWVGTSSIKASDFERNLDLKIRREQQTSEQSTQGGRNLLLISDFRIEISFKIESFQESVTKTSLKET